MKTIKVISLFGILAMTAVLVYGFTVGNFSGEGSLLLSMPWGIVSMVDLYVGFIIFSAWILYREEKLVIGILWTAGMMVLGFFTASLYVFITAIASKDDWSVFFMGKHAKFIAGINNNEK